MNTLQKEMVERIRRTGPMPFAAYMQFALYDPQHGYYSSGKQRTGWRGHFITSPELDPSFGVLWARAFRDVWVACGSPDRFEVAEIGPGEGGFARAVLESVETDFAAALSYRLIERVAVVRDRQRAVLDGFSVEWSESITELPPISAGCIFANEVLDNLPVHLVEVVDGEFKEVCVGETNDELVFVTRPPSNPELFDFLARVGVGAEEGTRYEVTLAGESLIAHTTQRLNRGALFFVDYGMTALEIAERGGTLVAYSASGADTQVLEHVGEKDITAHANWTSVVGALGRAGLAATGPVPQRDVLLALGAKDLEAEIRSGYEGAISEGRGADAVAALSRRQGLGALLDPWGLGGLGVVAGFKNVDRLPYLSDQ
ncbi:MAG: hypothetical protein QOG04_1191 [Actinomycetota bacterium]|nr:hypothetical protein [Actinomycetota bacterium]